MATEIEYLIEEPKNDCCKHWVNTIAKGNPNGYPNGIKCQNKKCGHWHQAELKIKPALAA